MPDTGLISAQPSYVTRDLVIGLLIGLLSAAGIGITSLLVHLETDSLTAVEINLGRAVIGLLITLPLVWRDLGRLCRRECAAVWVRALAGAVSVLCFMWNLQHTNVGLANILFNISLMLLVMVGYFAGEVRFTLRTVANLGLVTAGIWVYWYSVELSLSKEVMAVGIVGALAAAIAYTALKKATQVANPWLINWATCIASVPVSLLVHTNEWLLPSAPDLIILCAIGFGVLISQYLLTLSFARLSLSLATALTPSCVIWSVVAETFTIRTQVAYQSIAGALIYAVGIGALVLEAVRNKPPFSSRVPLASSRDLMGQAHSVSPSFLPSVARSR